MRAFLALLIFCALLEIILGEFRFLRETLFSEYIPCYVIDQSQTIRCDKGEGGNLRQVLIQLFK